MALGIAVCLFLRIFGLGLWLGGGASAAGLAHQFFVQHWEHVMISKLRSRTCFLTTKLLEVGIVVGLAQFLFNVGSRVLPLG
jgi:hypothetical protein